MNLIGKLFRHLDGWTGPDAIESINSIRDEHNANGFVRETEDEDV